MVIGPTPSRYLIVEGSVDAALEHLHAEYGQLAAPQARSALPPLSELTLYDSKGRTLRSETQHGAPSLIIDDDADHRGELCARVEQIFTEVRVLAYRDPTVLYRTPLDHPGQVRPPDAPDRGPAAPSDEAFAEFFAELLCRLQTDPTEHPGSWWHNLFHH